MSRVDSTIAAAIQAAALAQDYGLAINLVREYGLMDRCLSCVCAVEDGFEWTFDAPLRRYTLRTCRACTESFALWYVSKSPSRRMFEGALRGNVWTHGQL